MKVVMKVNLGSRDAGQYGLDYRKCVEGAEVDVDEKVADDLVRRRYATVVTPAEIKAVPDSPSISEASGPEIKADEKPARGAAKKSNTSQKDEQ